MSDVRLYQTVDGGEINVLGGRFELDDTPATAAYLSMFGGNELDAGTTATERRQWWGNFLEEDGARRYRSETQHLLRSIPAVTANLRRIEDAAERDLAWMVASLSASVTASATLPALGRIGLDVSITVGDVTYRLRIEEAWGSA